MTSPVAFELPPELAIDTDIARRVIAEFIRGQLRQAGFERAVLGLSGGIDSALVAFLVAEAIGAERLLCVLMPYRTSSPASLTDAEEVVRRLGCASEVVEITPMVDGFYGPETDASALRRGNFMARMRMSALYDRSVTWNGLVVGTGNKTESLIGYTTIFGDSACAFNPIGDLYKSQVRQMAAAIGRAGSRSSRRPRRPTCGPTRPMRARVSSVTRSSIDCCSGGSTSGARSTRSWRSGSTGPWSSGSTGWSPAPSSSARSRRSPSSGRGRRASTTCTRVGDRARRGSERALRHDRRPVARR